ncbi:hypothetical protein [uncultured Faecalibaculum sp.]|uniref:hypothetical protein n=1 Tax=uncultured Faecalibaculum sp. TaxID=1729681 RepID=UPI00260F4F48|nr:hypothetical protein [uncultured Faecalibaculum sp.]
MKKLIQTTAAAALSVSGLLSSIPMQILAEETEPEVTEIQPETTEQTEAPATLPEPEADPEPAPEETPDDTNPAPDAQDEPEEEEKKSRESDYDGLQGLTGNFERVENGYKLANTGGNNHNLSQLNAKAFDFAADIEYINGKNVSLMFGAETSHPGNYGTFFGLELCNDGGNLRVKLFQDGPGGLGDGVIPYTDAGTAVDGTKAHLAVSVSDAGELSIAVNGTAIPVTFQKDFKTRYAGGYIGLLT